MAVLLVTRWGSDPTGGNSSLGGGEWLGPGSPLRLCAVGDIFLGRGVTASLKRNGGEYNDVFAEILPALYGDLCFGNLEGPLSDNEPPLEQSSGIIRLCNPIESLHALQTAGFNCLSIANNHTSDLGVGGITDTVRWLEQAGIVPVGAGFQPAGRLTVKGIRIAVLAYTCHSPPPQSDCTGLVNEFDLARALKEVRAQAAEADLVVVSLHWGTEDGETVLPVQQRIARQLVDAGADAIFGHGAHRFQGAELYRDRPILYGLGNFIFDQEDPRSQEGLIARMEFHGSKCTKLQWIPYAIQDKSRIVLLKGARGRRLRRRASTLVMKGVGLD